MRDFIAIWKRRFLQRETLWAILLSLVFMLVSYVVRASPEIATYFKLKSGRHFAVADLPGVLTEDAAARVQADYLTVAASQAFSFYILMSNGFLLYHLLANIIIVLPILRFFNERKSGILQLTTVRRGNWSSIALEAFAASLSGTLLVLLPSLIFWALALLASPTMFPLSQAFAPFSDDFFQYLGQPEHIAGLYLVLILLNGILYFCRSLLAFSFALLVERKAILLFIPLAFTYAMYLLFTLLGIPGYAALSQFEEHIKTLAPLLLSSLLPLLAATLVFGCFCKKENILHA